MRDKSRILLIIGASHHECYRTAIDFDLKFELVEWMRFIFRAPQLRGWPNATPFIGRGRDRWPQDLDDAVHALTVAGRLRIANEHDLSELQKGFVPPRQSLSDFRRAAL